MATRTPSKSVVKAEQEIRDLIRLAYENLEKRGGFEARPPQKEMSEFVAGCLEVADHGLVEAPTGVGKSLGALIPAIARAIVKGERILVATYTNVLAEQYWRKDLPLALSLFGELGNSLHTEMVLGKQRYACFERASEPEIQQLPRRLRSLVDGFLKEAAEGLESEFMGYMRRNEIPAGMARDVWAGFHVPPVCRQRQCQFFHRCFYFNVRRSAEKASIIITNHSVILADAEMRLLTGGKLSMLDEYHALILDEAHDFIDSVRSAFEFTLDGPTLTNVTRFAGRLVNQLIMSLEKEAEGTISYQPFFDLAGNLSLKLNETALELEAKLSELQNSAIITAWPSDLFEYDGVMRGARRELAPVVNETAEKLKLTLEQFYGDLRKTLKSYEDQFPENAIQEAKDLLNLQGWYFKKFASGVKTLVSREVGVTWAECGRDGQRSVRSLPLEYAAMLKERLWDACPTIAMSATLAIDDSFDFFQKQTGLTHGVAACKLEPMFDYSTHAALYMPKQGYLFDPPARSNDKQAARYYHLVAEEVRRIIEATQGRALVLFSSRAEMEAVRERIGEIEYPILMQGKAGHHDLSNQFKKETNSVLFGLRSFWTGFDAPGDTLSCVVLVRVPFEVPIDPPQLARSALIQARGGNPFMDWTLPNAKQQIKQGSGRLLRASNDRGLICILDARIHTKRYGREILANLPPGMQLYHDIEQAVAAVGI